MKYTRGAFGNWRGRGRGQEESPPGHRQGQGYRGTVPSDPEGYNNWRGSSRSWRGVQGDFGRGGFGAPRGEVGNWRSGQSEQGRGGENDSWRSGQGGQGRGGENDNWRSGQGGQGRGGENDNWRSGQGEQGRGGHDTLRGGTNSWGRGRGDQGGRGLGATRGALEGGGRGRGRGRGQGGVWEGFSDQEKAEILSTRASTVQISSEGSDDLIVPKTTGVPINLAGLVLAQNNLDALQSPRQMELFLQSCLLNLSNHHSVDTSGVLYSLASEKGLAKLRHIMLQPVSTDDDDEMISVTVSFQDVILPLIGVLTRQSVCQTTLTHESNLIYGLVQEHSQKFFGSSVLPSMQSLLDGNLVHASSRASTPSLRHQQHEHDQQKSPQVGAPLHCALLAIVRLFYQLVLRFPNSATHMVQLIKRLVALVKQCLQQATTTPALRTYLKTTLIKEIKRLAGIVNDKISSRCGSKNQPSHVKSSTSPSTPVNGPGELSLHGPRHDNDHALIDKIDILPTVKEVLYTSRPYLPVNNDKEHPTHFLPRGWSRHLDVHFRLYRQDMLDPLCAGIQAFAYLLRQTDKRDDHTLADPKKLKQFINNVGLNVYSNVKFRDVSTEGFQAGLVTLSFDQPPRIKGVTYKDRLEFWEQSRGRVMQGGLVCMMKRCDPQVGDDYQDFQVVLAMVQERNIHELSKSDSAAYIQVSLTDPKFYPKVFTPLSSIHSDYGRWFLIECPGSFFESYRPVLKALQTKMPSTLPFGKYIAPTDKDTQQLHGSSSSGVIDPPHYTLTPGFKFDLSVLLKKGDPCGLDVRDKVSVDRAVAMLRKHSSLDDTQASALVETLGREIALISGPPGTGKTKIGVDLMKVLLHNKQAMNSGPILVICYTNHALDQFLEHLLDEGYTKIARLGSQSKSQRLQECNLKTMMGKRLKPYAARRAIAEAFQASELAAESIRELTLELKSGYFGWRHVRNYLKVETPAQCRQFEHSPPAPVVWRDNEEEEDSISSSLLSGQCVYERWATGKDIAEKRVWNRLAAEKDRKGVRPTNIFAALDEDSSKSIATRRYEISESQRPLSLLGGDVWSMSMDERCRLIESWRSEIVQSIEEELEQHHRSLKSSEERKFNGYDELRRLILSGMDVIGMTTSGSAKYHTLLESVAPKIIMCEEAGEVLECHVLTALSSCTQQLILIGDHLQLRPQVQTYSLSSDSAIGKKYNLDISLFERLVDSETPLPMSRLTVQRRMRPEISSLIRNTLYPTLEDGVRVFQYPDVNGMGTNLFFLDHSHPEDKKDPFGAQSHANTFEVGMIKALALYLIKNGYNQPGDIAILTPYLGQLAKFRDHLKDQFVVLVDERDQEGLDTLGAGGVAEALQGTPSPKKTPQSEVALQNHITIRTIDNYQGEEAKIVIVSLVRSDIGAGDELLPGSIGFLKSPNRTNVLLSRAQHGMFLVGNSGLMAQPKHGIWPSVIGELKASGRVGVGFPITCKNHPETKKIVCSPEELQALAPDGGCTLPCGGLLSCSHLCPRSCHPDDKKHILVKCREPCLRPRSGCDHACQGRCWEDCGNCNVIVSPLPLPCGHVLERPKCWQSSDPTQVVCTVKVVRTLASCGHTLKMRCHQDPAAIECTEKCPSVLGCGHPCPSNCHDPNLCSPCGKKCTVSCTHTRCSHDCQTQCTPCCLDCAWECEHRDKCTLPCAAPCDRLPCNERCEKELPCGHQCPSICGEKCPSLEFCPECCRPGTWVEVYDRAGVLRLSGVDANEHPILVPPCGHALTVSTFDELMDLGRYYRAEKDVACGLALYVALKDPIGGPYAQAKCNVCSNPIGESFFRYGRPVKHKKLLDLMDSFFKSHFRKQMNEDNQCYLDAIDSIASAKDAFVQELANTKATPQSTPPRSTAERVWMQDGVVVGDLGDIALLYQIPWQHQLLWAAAIKPAKDVLVLCSHILVDQSPLNEIITILVNQSRTLGQDSSWRRMDTIVLPSQVARRSSIPPTGEEMSQAILTLGLASIDVPNRAAKQQQPQLDYGRVSMIMMSVYNLAFDAMKAAGAESGWYWFVRDLLTCCQEYNHRFRKANHNRRDRPALATQLVLEGFCLELYWLTARPLGGMKRIEEFWQAVNEVERAFSAEVNKLQRTSDGGEFSAEDEAMVSRIEKEMRVLIGEARQQCDKAAHRSILDEEKEW